MNQATAPSTTSETNRTAAMLAARVSPNVSVRADSSCESPILRLRSLLPGPTCGRNSFELMSAA